LEDEEETLEKEEELELKEGNDRDAELQDLQKMGEVPLEELLKMYKGSDGMCHWDLFVIAFLLLIWYHAYADSEEGGSSPDNAETDGDAAGTDQKAVCVPAAECDAIYVSCTYISPCRLHYRRRMPRRVAVIQIPSWTMSPTSQSPSLTRSAVSTNRNA